MEWFRKSFKNSAEEDLRSLPGFDEEMHKSSVVDETIEEKDGRRFVTYRTKREITDAALANFNLPLFKR